MQLCLACGSDNKSILRHVLNNIPQYVKVELKHVYFTSFVAINEVVPIQHLYEKCGGKCANFLISALAIVLTHAWQGVAHCRVNDTSNPDCEPRIYAYANQSIENMEPVAVTCFETVGIPITPQQSRHIAVSMCNAIINAVRSGGKSHELPSKPAVPANPTENNGVKKDFSKKEIEVQNVLEDVDSVGDDRDREDNRQIVG